MGYYGIPWLDRFLGTPLEARALELFERRQQLEQAAYAVEDRFTLPIEADDRDPAAAKAAKEQARVEADQNLAKMQAELTAASQALEDEFVAYRRAQAYAPDWQAMSKGLGALDDYVVDAELSKALEAGDFDAALDLLEKGAGHKYIRRIPTGDAKRKWTYIYNVTSDKHGQSPKVGEKIQVKHGDKAGHYEVTHDHGEHVTMRHDESGHEMKIHKDHVHELFAQEHEDAIDAAHKRLARTHEKARIYGTDAQAKRAKAALDTHREKYGYGKERVDESQWVKLPSGRKIKKEDWEKEQAEKQAAVPEKAIAEFRDDLAEHLAKVGGEKGIKEGWPIHSVTTRQALGYRQTTFDAGMAALERTGHVKRDKDGDLKLTAKGAEWANRGGDLRGDPMGHAGEEPKKAPPKTPKWPASDTDPEAKERAEAYGEFGGQGKFAMAQLERVADWRGEAEKKAYEAKEYVDAAKHMQSAVGKISRLADDIDKLNDAANNKTVSIMRSVAEKLGEQAKGYARMASGDEKKSPEPEQKRPEKRPEGTRLANLERGGAVTWKDRLGRERTAVKVGSSGAWMVFDEKGDHKSSPGSPASLHKEMFEGSGFQVHEPLERYKPKELPLAAADVGKREKEAHAKIQAARKEGDYDAAEKAASDFANEMKRYKQELLRRGPGGKSVVPGKRAREESKLMTVANDVINLYEKFADAARREKEFEAKRTKEAAKAPKAEPKPPAERETPSPGASNKDKVLGVLDNLRMDWEDADMAEMVGKYSTDELNEIANYYAHRSVSGEDVGDNVHRSVTAHMISEGEKKRERDLRDALKGAGIARTREDDGFLKRVRDYNDHAAKEAAKAAIALEGHKDYQGREVPASKVAEAKAVLARLHEKKKGGGNLKKSLAGLEALRGYLGETEPMEKSGMGNYSMAKADDGKPGESLGETSTEELQATAAKLKGKTDGNPALEARYKAIMGELQKRTNGGEGMQKSGLEGLQDYLVKAGMMPGPDPDGLPKGEPKMGHPKSAQVDGGSADGGELDGVGKTSGSGDSAPAPGTGKDGLPTGTSRKKEKWSEDDADEEKQMTDHKKALEQSVTRKSLTPAAQREAVAREHAAKVYELRKGEPDVRAGGPVHPLSNTAVHVGVDQAASELCKSEFYYGPPPTLSPPGSTLRKSVLCKSDACGKPFAAALTACPHCGDETVQSRLLPHGGHLGGSAHAAIVLEKSNAPLLRPAPTEPDLYVPGNKKG